MNTNTNTKELNLKEMAKMNGGDGVIPMVPLRPFPPGGISRPGWMTGCQALFI